MIGDLPRGPRGQFLAVALTITAILGIWLGVAAPLAQWHANRAERLMQRQVLARHMARVAAELPGLRRQVADAAGSGPPPLAVLAGESDPIAGAALQGLIRDLARRAGVDVSSAEMLPAEAAGRYRRIGVRVQVFAPQWPMLVGLLQSIAQATPRILVDDLQIHGLPQRHQQEGPPIDASFTAFGFRATKPGK